MEMTILDEVDEDYEEPSTIESFLDEEGGVSGQAKSIVQLFKEELIGQIFVSEPMGDYTGGKAEVVEVFPDDDNDGICMNVKQLSTGRIMGTFNDEYIYSFHTYSDWKGVDILENSVKLITDKLKGCD